MAGTEPEDSTTTNQAHRLPTVAELAAMPDAELAERHDAQVARSWETGEPASDVYLGELGRRMAELREERTLRILLAAWVASTLVLLITLFVLIVAL
jgi:hypothetical protein